MTPPFDASTHGDAGRKEDDWGIIKKLACSLLRTCCSSSKSALTFFKTLSHLKLFVIKNFSFCLNTIIRNGVDFFSFSQRAILEWKK